MSGQTVRVSHSPKILVTAFPAVELNGTPCVNNCSDKSYSENKMT